LTTADGRLARVTLDGKTVATVSGYTADEIREWPLFEHAWPAAGAHARHIEVLGKSDPRGSGTKVWLDAVSVEP
jgi:hypothetical protein